MQFAIPAAAAFRNQSTCHRLPGLDALRGLATVLVVLLHAGIPYMMRPMPFLVWPAKEVHPCPVVDGLTWCSECFLMPLFFMLAGFFSHGLLISRGASNFLSGRTRRLLTTQLAAYVVILPACLWIWSMGWAAEGTYEPQDYFLRGIPTELEAELFGVAHLWFLQNLYIYCLILCGASWLAKRIPAPGSTKSNWLSRSLRCIDKLLVSVWKPLIPAIPCALILYFDTRIVLGFYQTFVPVVSKLVYYAIYFFVGVMLYRQREELHLHARFSKRYLCIAAILFSATLPLIHEHLTAPLSGQRLALMSGLLALFAWFTVFGLFAIFLKTRYGNNFVTRYLAEASFWMYLVHLPLVVLAQIAIAHLPFAALGKFLLAGMTAIVLALLSYQVFVRGRWLGEFLDGRCRPQPLLNGPETVISVSPPVFARDANAGHVTRRYRKAALWVDRPENHRDAMQRRRIGRPSGIEHKQT